MTAAPRWWADTRAELAPVLADTRIAVYASGGAPYHHAALIAQWGGVPEPVDAAQIRTGALATFDVLIMPGGGLLGMGGLLTPLGAAGSEAIRDWVAGGGMYIGSCAGAYLPATVPASFAELHPAVLPLQLLDLPLANGAAGGLGGLDSPGVGVLHAAVATPDHWLARNLPPHIEVVHYNGPCFVPTDDAGVTAVTRVEGTGDAFTPWERSLPGHAALLVDTLVADRAANVVGGTHGQGTVVLFGSHPEFGFDVLQLGWGEAARLFGNALVHQARRAAHPAAPWPTEARVALEIGTLPDDLQDAALRFAALAAAAPELRGAPAFQGRDAAGVWTAALAEAATLCADTAAYLRTLDLGSVPEHCAAWLDHPASPGQDYGFVGLRQLAVHIRALLEEADMHLRSPPPPVTSPYDQWERHPYHLLASTYLSAAGLAASAALAASTLGTLAGTDLPPPHPIFREDSP